MLNKQHDQQQKLEASIVQILSLFALDSMWLRDLSMVGWFTLASFWHGNSISESDLQQ
jgi:hypothetical protein